MNVRSGSIWVARSWPRERPGSADAAAILIGQKNTPELPPFAAPAKIGSVGWSADICSGKTARIQILLRISRNSVRLLDRLTIGLNKREGEAAKRCTVW